MALLFSNWYLGFISEFVGFPLIELRIMYSSKQLEKPIYYGGTAFILLSLFRTSLHILDCNSRLSALIMRRHIRYIQFISTTIYCLGQITVYHSFKHWWKRVNGNFKKIFGIAQKTHLPHWINNTSNQLSDSWTLN